MKWLRTLTLNVLLMLALTGALLLSPPLFFQLHKTVTNLFSEISVSGRTYTQAEAYAIEYERIRSKYRDFISWRSEDFQGSQINIENGVRKTSPPIDLNKELAEYWFFGGSTTWGYGVEDRSTFPSVFARENGAVVSNFGESGYITRQEWSYLSNILALNAQYRDMTGIHVVFYDGVNDIAHRCQSQSSMLGTGRERQIQSAIVQSISASDLRWSLNRTFAQLIDMISALVARLPFEASQESIDNFYACANNPAKARQVASSQVNLWKMASDLVVSRGGRFSAILQPVAYMGDPIVEDLNINSPAGKALANQYATVYPLIRDLASQASIDFIDLTRVFDGCAKCYFDFCHATPHGHEILVEAIASHLINSSGAK